MTTPNDNRAGERTQHTPGPWMTDDETVNHGPIIIQRNFPSIEVAAIYGNGRDERAANARLIAVAPELLAILKRARAIIAGSDIEHVWMNHPVEPSIGLGDMIDSVIAKAEGQGR